MSEDHALAGCVEVAEDPDGVKLYSARCRCAEFTYESHVQTVAEGVVYDHAIEAMKLRGLDSS